MTQSPKEFTLTFTDADLQVLAQALENLAFKFASPLFNKINSQLAPQLAPPAQASVDSLPQPGI